MPKILDYIIVDGAKFNKCPLCSGPCTVSSWNKNKVCTDCNRLLDKGLTQDEVKRIRATNESSKALIEDSIDIEAIIDVPKGFTSVDSLPEYDFRKKFPPGMDISVRGKDESVFLKQVYLNYYRRFSNLDTFDEIVYGVLQAKLEMRRNSERLCEEINAVERNSIQQTNVKLTEQITRTISTMEQLKSEASSQSMNVFTKEAAAMYAYHFEHEQEYTGIGLCPDCGKRIIFKTNFPTFKSYYTDEIDKIYKKAMTSADVDTPTLDYITEELKKSLDENSTIELYVVKHVRELESALQ